MGPTVARTRTRPALERDQRRSRAPGRSMLITVWGENVHERTDDARARDLPRRDARDDRRGPARAARRRRAGPHRHARGARARADRGGPGRHRRPDLVGPHRPRARSTTPWSTACRTRCWAAWACSCCTRATTRRSSGGCWARRAACAGATTASASWSGPSRPAHPIAAGVPHPIVIDAQEMYGEHFDIPAPDELVFVSSFAGGEVFRGGCCFTPRPRADLLLQPRRPGVPRLPPPRRPRVLANAVAWAAPRRRARGGAPRAPSRRAGWFERVTLRHGRRDRAAARRRRRRRAARPATGRASCSQHRDVELVGWVDIDAGARRARPRRRSALGDVPTGSALEAMLDARAARLPRQRHARRPPTTR